MSQDSSVIPIQASSSLRERVEIALASAIRSGEMKPGELFSAPTLAVRFNVSATPVREAMLNLEKRGFVETVRNKGFRVTRVSDKDLATEELATSANEHLELLALLQAGEGDAAERLMHRHIAHVIGWWAGRPEEE